MINIVVITHGNLARELLATASLIIGPQPDVEALALAGNESLASLTARVGGIVSRLGTGDGALLLTDMLGGTPCNASLSSAPSGQVEIVTGVNLYMLISACTNRSAMDVHELAQKAIDDGRKNIADAKAIFLKRVP